MSTPKTDTATLDAAIFAVLKTYETEDQPGFLQALVSAYLEDTQAACRKLLRALTDENIRTISEEAHILKSSSASIGASRMSEIAARLERLARSPAPTFSELAQEIQSMAEEFPRIQSALRKEVPIDTSIKKSA